MAEAIDSPREIDWSTAEVKDGALGVELTGDPSRDWSEHMEAVIARLEHGRWGTIKVGRRRIKVASVSADSVDDLRHLLESAALQTNADLVAPAQDAAPAGQLAADVDAADQDLTRAFRALAPARPE
ncbi:MAG TPA: hypothetical protein VFR49_03875 [Solirubrobacteraceae bacterium]|nr:hypothetical protein [Solirubrobacteraceae bacterium]